MRLIDFAARQISPADIKAAGYDGVVAYVSESRPGASFGAKPLTREYADSLRAAGLHIVSNYQFGKPGGAVPSDFTRGFDGGVADAHTAMRLHAEAGGPDTAPIIFSVDDDVDLDTWNRVAVEWFRGINTVLGVERTGIYGHSRVCAWAIQDDVIGRSTTAGQRWAWQTKAWSFGEREPAAVLYQGVVDTASNPGPLVGGTRVDVNDVLAADFGQWDLAESTRSVLIAPDFEEHTDIRSPYHGSRGGSQVLWFVLHTEDGNSGSARNLARFLSNNSKQVSYHYTVDDDGHVYDVVDTDQYANSVLQPGNSKSINLAFAGTFGGWTRQRWLDEMQHGIDVAAYIAVRDTRRYGLQTLVISPEEARQGETGVTDHNGVRIATGVGTHWDVGPEFPWDYFRQKIEEYAATPTGQTTRKLPTLAYPGHATREGSTGRHVAMLQDRLNSVAAAGLLVDGEFGPLTRRAVRALQDTCAMVADGEVGPTTWARLFPDREAQPYSDGEPTPASDDETMPFSERKAALYAERDEVERAERAERSRDRHARSLATPPRDVTGPGITTSIAMEAADLGILRWDPDRNAIAAMFGDNFEFEGMHGEWQSPSIVMYDNDYRVLGVPDPGNRIAMRRRRQLWPYPHNNPEYSTILPCDYIRIGDWWHVAVMVTQGLGNELRTEFHRSRDLVSWEVAPELTLRHPSHPGNIMLTFDQIGDYVYIFGTGGLARDRGIWMWRNHASDFPRGWWEPWGWDGSRWDWGIPNEGTPMLEGQYGELSFRSLQGNCVLSYFDAAGYRQQARTVQRPEDNWRDGANVVDYAFGWQIPRLYGGYISPLSRLNEPDGMHFFVSQWAEGNVPYKAILVQDTLGAAGDLREVARPPRAPSRPPEVIDLIAAGASSSPAADEPPAKVGTRSRASSKTAERRTNGKPATTRTPSRRGGK
jgi:N-acetyl-anhydromuramyl-L-alanine amidase AmpD